MPASPIHSPTKQVVLQRIRNRIIECLELTASFEAQRDYQASVPVSVPNEVINQWEDWYPGDDRALSEPVFTAEERAALDAFHRVWTDTAASAPDPLPPLDEAQQLPEWTRLRDAAHTAAAVLMRRGRLSEEDAI